MSFWENIRHWNIWGSHTFLDTYDFFFLIFIDCGSGNIVRNKKWSNVPFVKMVNYLFESFRTNKKKFTYLYLVFNFSKLNMNSNMMLTRHIRTRYLWLTILFFLEHWHVQLMNFLFYICINLWLFSCNLCLYAY